jgi:hypothetical protein
MPQGCKVGDSKPTPTDLCAKFPLRPSVLHFASRSSAPGSGAILAPVPHTSFWRFIATHPTLRGLQGGAVSRAQPPMSYGIVGKQPVERDLQIPIARGFSQLSGAPSPRTLLLESNAVDADSFAETQWVSTTQSTTQQIPQRLLSALFYMEPPSGIEPETC